jgi:hypothetical protein
MLIRDLPPDLAVIDEPASTKIDSEDVVVSVHNIDGCMIGVRLRKRGIHGSEYTVTLRIPEDALQQTILAVIRAGRNYASRHRRY